MINQLVFYPKVQVFILTHDRPDIVLETLKSVLAQTYKNFEVIMSDNSFSNETSELVNKVSDPRFVYKRRTGVFSSTDHFNLVLQEASADYFMLFHDDDVMLPDCLETLLEGFFFNKNLIAVGGNAKIIYNSSVSNIKIITKEQNLLIKSPKALLRRYLLSLGISPFPSYMYSKMLLGDLTFEPDKGKHSDVIFLATACLKGRLLMKKDLVMLYRVHANQDSEAFNFSDRSLLSTWCVKNGYFSKQEPEIKIYRLTCILRKLIRKNRLKFNLIVKLSLALLLMYIKCDHSQFFSVFIVIWKIIVKRLWARKSVAGN